MRKHAAAVLYFVAASVVMTWPLARLVDRAVSDPGDPFIVIWFLDWNWWATFRAPLSLFHANAFHPAPYALAFSENVYGISLFTFPFRLVGVPPIATYNLALLGGFAFSGYAAHLLALRLTGSFAASLAAGTFYAFVPFRFAHLSHLQHVWGGWMPLLLLALIAYVDRPDWKRALLAAAAFLMNALTNIHWMFFGTFATVAAAALFGLTGFREWKKLLAGLAVAALLLIPFLYPYAAVAREYGMTRTWEDAKRFSATVSDCAAGVDNVSLHRSLVDADVDPERRLFPGFLPIALTISGLLFIRSYPRAGVLGTLWLAIGFFGSLGLNFYFHDFLFDAVPGFRAIRAPARWAGVAHAGMAMLMAVAVAATGRFRAWVGGVATILLLVELHAAPIRWYLTHPDPPPVYTWLAEQKDVRVVAELPINYLGSEYRYLLRSVHHHKRLINGVSGFTPPFTARLTEMSKSDPVPAHFLDELRRVGCDLIVVHGDALGDFSRSTREWLRTELLRGRLRFVRRFDSGLRGDWVFAVGKGGGIRSSELEAFLDDRWTRNSTTFGLMDPPPRVVSGPATFRGFALSPHGVEKVDLLFANGAVRVPAQLVEDRSLSEGMPWYPATSRPRFIGTLAQRPRGVRPRTDVQAEVTDGLGSKTRLEHMWFEWRD